MLTRKNFYTVFTICLSILLTATLLFACAPADNGADTVIEGADQTLPLQIYRCDDVYRTDDTPTHGEGTVTLAIEGTGFEVTDCQLLFCDDGCEQSAVVSRASQGYAVAYNTVLTRKLEGNYPTFVFSMGIPEPMVEDLIKQGIYEQFVEELEREYYYLLKLDRTYYAYICIEPMEGTEKLENEAEIVDGIVKNAKISFSNHPAADTSEQPIITTQPIEYILPLECNTANREYLYPVSAYGDVLYYAYSTYANVGIYPLTEGYGTGYVTVAKRNDFTTPSTYYYTYRITCKDGAVTSTEEVETIIKPAVLENGKPYAGKLEGEHQSKSYSYYGDLRMRTVVFSGDNVEIYSYIDGTDAGGKYFGPYQYDETTGYFSAELTFEYHDGSTMELKQNPAGKVSGWIYEYCGFVHFICENEKVAGLTVSENDPLPMTFAMPTIEDTASEGTALYKKAKKFLWSEFHRVFDPYYDIQSLTISNWEENGNEATFNYNMTYIYYNRDPDKVEYIRQAKEVDEERYKMLYEDYLAPKQMNCEFKFVLNGEEIELYANVSPTGTEWERRNIDDYVMR